MCICGKDKPYLHLSFFVTLYPSDPSSPALFLTRSELHPSISVELFREPGDHGTSRRSQALLGTFELQDLGVPENLEAPWICEIWGLLGFNRLEWQGSHAQAFGRYEEHATSIRRNVLQQHKSPRIWLSGAVQDWDVATTPLEAFQKKRRRVRWMEFG